MMSASDLQLHARTDHAVRAVVLHVWPGSVYDVPFFVSMQHLAEGAARTAIVTAVLAPSDEAVCAPMPNVIVAVNGRELQNVAWRAYELLDITSHCTTGRNVLSLRNAHPDDSAAVLVAIELRRAMDAAAFISRIPRDADDIGLDALCFGAGSTNDHASTHDVQALGVVASSTCPITRGHIHDCVRGRTCKHAQGFDACAFLSLAAISGAWRCPLCCATLFPEDLVRIDLPRKRV